MVVVYPVRAEACGLRTGIAVAYLAARYSHHELFSLLWWVLYDKFVGQGIELHAIWACCGINIRFALMYKLLWIIWVKCSVINCYAKPTDGLDRSAADYIRWNVKKKENPMDPPSQSLLCRRLMHVTPNIRHTSVLRSTVHVLLCFYTEQWKSYIPRGSIRANRFTSLVVRTPYTTSERLYQLPILYISDWSNGRFASRIWASFIKG